MQTLKKRNKNLASFKKSVQNKYGLLTYLSKMALLPNSANTDSSQDFTGEPAAEKQGRTYPMVYPLALEPEYFPLRKLSEYGFYDNLGKFFRIMPGDHSFGI